jgi:oxidase EvaA
MDARSVISIIPLIDDELFEQFEEFYNDQTRLASFNEIQLSKLNQDLIHSLITKNKAFRTMNQLISWYTTQKVNYELTTKIIPLKKLSDWNISEDSIYSSDRYFSVIGVDVIAGTREVSKWTQPLIKDTNIGLLGILIKKINGIIHVLVQAKVEPGHIDVLELCPTVSCSNINYIDKKESLKPEFYNFFKNASKENILYDTIQSEEGGRFFQLQNRNMIVTTNAKKIYLPNNYMWMTVNQISKFMKYSMFNIEARSLISSLTFIK